MKKDIVLPNGTKARVSINIPQNTVYIYVDDDIVHFKSIPEWNEDVDLLIAQDKYTKAHNILESVNAEPKPPGVCKADWTQIQALHKQVMATFPKTPPITNCGWKSVFRTRPPELSFIQLRDEDNNVFPGYMVDSGDRVTFCYLNTYDESFSTKPKRIANNVTHWKPLSKFYEA